LIYRMIAVFGGLRLARHRVARRAARRRVIGDAPYREVANQGLTSYGLVLDFASCAATAATPDRLDPLIRFTTPAVRDGRVGLSTTWACSHHDITAGRSS
jgi:hypothetical protein